MASPDKTEALCSSSATLKGNAEMPPGEAAEGGGTSAFSLFLPAERAYPQHRGGNGALHSSEVSTGPQDFQGLLRGAHGDQP